MNDEELKSMGFHKKDNEWIKEYWDMDKKIEPNYYIIYKDNKFKFKNGTYMVS